MTPAAFTSVANQAAPDPKLFIIYNKSQGMDIIRVGPSIQPVLIDDVPEHGDGCECNSTSDLLGLIM